MQIIKATSNLLSSGVGIKASGFELTGIGCVFMQIDLNQPGLKLCENKVWECGVILFFISKLAISHI